MQICSAGAAGMPGEGWGGLGGGLPAEVRGFLLNQPDLLLQ